MKHEFLDHHREGDSLVHRLDPRLKIFLLLSYIFMVVSLPFDSGYRLFLFGSVPLALALLSRVSLPHYASKLLKIYPMIFFITFLLPFLPVSGEQAVTLGPLKIYPTGLNKFLVINTKSVFSIWISIIMTTTTEFNQFLKGMETLRFPTLVILILSFMYRFIFLLIDEAERMLMAFQSRYVHLSVLTRLKYLAQEIGVLFIRTFERSERVYQAMEARGFQGKIYSLSHFRWKGLDSAVLVLFSVALILLRTL